MLHHLHHLNNNRIRIETAGEGHYEHIQPFRTVSVSDKKNQQQGKKQLQWNAVGYADGIYYYRLQIGDEVANGKMVKVR